LTHLSSTYPLRFLSPTPTSSHHTTVYILSFGGGYVSGDTIAATIHIHQGCALSLLTRGWGRVFAHSKTDTDPSSASIGVRQSITTQIAAHALLVYLPHPLQMTSRARFVQRQQFVLHPAASLLVLDCFTCGRASRGETWDFELYESRNEICVQNEDGTRRTVPEEGMQQDGALSRSYTPRLYPYHIFATLFIIGPRLNALISHVTSSYSQFIITSKGTGNSINIQKGRDLIWSVSDI
ncbi:UreD urease accessory protein-domain-containing protein, partial [Gaertneriomyces semiglobifer]